MPSKNIHTYLQAFVAIAAVSATSSIRHGVPQANSSRSIISNLLCYFYIFWSAIVKQKIHGL